MTVAYVFGRWDAASPACTAAPDIPSDEVFRRIANGDRLAMRTLFVRYRVPVYRWLLRIVGDAAVAEDLLNDAFLDVCATPPPSTGALRFQLGCWPLHAIRR
jgi:RNA polymerase sigma-70 factor (ECF subfamily)